jgi:HD-GYP domain-containing protein (c-di-GMP phosphodiesterase class II)
MGAVDSKLGPAPRLAEPDIGEGLRLAELLAALSLATDLAHRVPLETSLKDALLSVGLARHLGLTGAELSDVYYLALLAHLGCTAYAEEQAQVSAGQDVAMRRTFGDADYLDRLTLLRLTCSQLAAGAGPIERARALARFLRAGKGFMLAGDTAMCEMAVYLGQRLDVGPRVTHALNDFVARWDGKVFAHPPGEAIDVISRITHLVRIAQIHALGRGPAGAAEVVRKRRGGEFDPTISDAFLEIHRDLFANLSEGSVWDQTLEAEPHPHRLVPQSHTEEITLAIADFTDVKTPCTLGHSRRVGALAEAAGACLGLRADDLQLLRRSGHVHDLGIVSVPQRVWMKDGRLSRPELEAIRLHTYHTERVLSSSRPLRPLASVAGFHHERLDGSGYHRGAGAGVQTRLARLLAAAEVYQSLLEDRSWRPAYTENRAAEVLKGEVGAGMLDRSAVIAVLEAAGQPRAGRRISWPAGLTDREVDILRLLAVGHSNRAIARILHVTEATVHTHAVNIYGKTGVHSRAGIGLFAIEHDLISAPKDQPNG